MKTSTLQNTRTPLWRQIRRCSVAADGALFILLIKRGGYPYKGCWALPGGFVNIDEDLPEAAKRELLEETNINIDYLERAAVWSRPDRDPRQRVITVSYDALTDKMNALAGDDARRSTVDAHIGL